MLFMEKKKWIIFLGAILLVVIAVFLLINNSKNNAEVQFIDPECLYTNTVYGFYFDLPESWKGYSIINDVWEGRAYSPEQDEQVSVEQGPKISIRHPLWTEEDPRQDIPIMIFTIAQWNDLQEEKFFVSVAPIGPSELGRNSTYVFALPPRYNFAFPTGFEEVEDIIDSNPLLPFD